MKKNSSMNKKPQTRSALNNEMLKFLGSHLLVGVLTAAIFLIAFVFLDIGGLRTLVHKNQLEFLVYPLLFVFFSITFGSSLMGVAIMGLGNKDKGSDNGTKIGALLPIMELSPVKINSKNRSK